MELLPKLHEGVSDAAATSQGSLFEVRAEDSDEEFEELSQHNSDKIESGFSEPELEATQSKLTDFVQKNDESKVKLQSKYDQLDHLFVYMC